ncbi:MAG: thiamine diphosphokinase [Marvinbryantia sp.]|jgi:thiamine pyrophosphokinase
MNTLIVNGGNIDFDFALAFIKNEKFDFVIAADKGMEFAQKAEICPDLIVGDFDSGRQTALQYFREKQVEIRTFRPEKDSTDMEIAMLAAVERGSTCITVLGASGSRLDHVLGSIKNLTIAAKAGVPCVLVDRNNRVRLMERSFSIKKEEQFGKYVSLLAFAEPVTGITLKGFFYPLNGYTMGSGDAIGISNEIVDEEATVEFDTGRLLVIESRD